MLVKELEQQVGARLFDRNTRAITLTDAGQRLRAPAERILDELRALGEVIAGTEATVRARLDVAATPMLSASLLPRVLRSFNEAHPKIRVHIHDVDVAGVRRRVLEGESDIGLGFFVKPAVGLLRQPLCNFQLMRIGPPTGRTDRTAQTVRNKGILKSEPWSSLASLPLVCLPADNPIQVLIETHLTRVRMVHTERLRANFLGTLVGMVEAGLGYAVIPSFALNECLRRGLSIALLIEPAVHLDLYLISRRGSQAKPAATEFAAALKLAASTLLA